MQSENPKIIFFGTPEFAEGILKSLIENKLDVAAVFTQPDKKIGRKQEILFSPVKKLALANNIKIFQPESLRDGDIVEEIKNIKPDLFIVAAYGKILPKVFLEIPACGAINAHASLLPKYRGASPVQCAILAGEKETGITLMLMNERLDEGDILAQEKIAVGENETTGALSGKLEKLGAEMVAKFIPDWISGKIKPVAQNQKKATYCRPIKRGDGRIDWNFSAGEIYRKWRAYHPWPGIFSIYGANNQPKRFKLLEIEVAPDTETGEKAGKVLRYNENIAVQAKKGLIILKKIQLEGKKESGINDFIKGHPDFVGTGLQ